jgi:TPR repeat protein
LRKGKIVKCLPFLFVLAIGTSAFGQPPAGLAGQLEALANAGNAEARYHLGMLYNNGIGVAQDNRRALALFREAAAAGDPLAAYKVGCYHAGQFGILAPDEAEALRYKLIAAEAGYSLAQLEVANLYTARQAYAHALPWYEAAAHQGEAQALYNLSVFYKEGYGVARSPAHTYAFFHLAHMAARGAISPGAQQTLAEMQAAMTEAERAEANRIVATWVTGLSPLTRRAFEGQSRAEALVRP